MRNIWSKLNNIKSNRYLILIPILVLVVGLIPFATNAQWASITNIAENALMAPIHTILLAIVGMLGALMQVVMYLFVAIAQYDGFATATAISLGWAMIRDLCNMVIVVYLLYTAFMYALGQGHVDLDKSLVNLVLVAIGVNFSKTITLLLVDVSQVVMLTFVNSFKNIGVAELYRIMNVGSFFTLSDKAVNTTSALATEFFTIIIMFVVLTVLGLFMAILVVRIVMIWLHIVLSPIYVAGFGVSWLKGYHDTWWKEMKEYLIIGPCLAFFIWLTFASLQQTTANALVPDPTKFENLKNTATAADNLGEIGTVDRISGLIVALAMLLGGITICSKYASSTGFPIGGFDKKLKDWSMGAVKFASTKLPADLARRSSRLLGSAGVKLEQSGFSRLGKTVGGAGAIVGTGVKVGRGVSEFLKQPGTIAKGLYERAVTGELGAAESSLTTALEQNLKTARDEMGKKNYNVNALQQQWSNYEKGGMKDKTMPEIMALFEEANKKGAFKTPTEYLNAIRKVTDAGKDSAMPGMAAMTKQWEAEQREKKFSKGSMHAKPSLIIGKDGKYGYDVEGSLAKVFEDSADRDEDNFWENVNNQDIDTTSVLGKSALKDGKIIDGKGYSADQFASSFLQTQLSHIMGTDEETLAQSKGKANKSKFRQNLANLAKASSYKEDGVQKSRLTTEQLGKIERLMAASLLDTDDARKAARAGKLNEAIDNNTRGEIGVDKNYLAPGNGRDITKPLGVGKDKDEEQVILEMVNKPHNLLVEISDKYGSQSISAGDIAQAKANTPSDSAEIIESQLDLKNQITSGGTVDLSDSSYEAAADLIAQQVAKSGGNSEADIDTFQMPSYTSTFDAAKLKSLVKSRIPQIQNYSANRDTVRKVYESQLPYFDKLASQTADQASESLKAMADSVVIRSGSAGVDGVNGLSDLQAAYKNAAEQVKTASKEEMAKIVSELRDITNNNAK